MKRIKYILVLFALLMFAGNQAVSAQESSKNAKDKKEKNLSKEEIAKSETKIGNAKSKVDKLDETQDQEGKKLADAIYKEDVKRVKSLIENDIGVNVDFRLHMRPLLLLAGDKGNVEIISILLAAGADANARGYKDETALMALAKSVTNQRAIIGSAPKGETQVTIAQLLVDHGADIGLKDNKGYTALDYASKKKVTQFYREGQMQQSERYFAPELYTYLKEQYEKNEIKSIYPAI